MKKKILALILALATLAALCACQKVESRTHMPDKTDGVESVEPEGELEQHGVVAKYPKEYNSMDIFRSMTVKDVVAEMDAGGTFAVFFGFTSCPSCQAVRPALLAAANATDSWIGFVNTRANPDWKSNMDIDDYDLFVERFGEYIPLDEDGQKHLYVPHIFFIRDGAIVFDYQGVKDEFDASTDTVDGELYQELLATYTSGFNLLQAKESAP